MKKILVVFANQWGYNTDYLFFCRLLQERFDVTFIGYDLKLPPVPAAGVTLIEVPYTGKLSLFKFYGVIFKEVRDKRYTHIFINYFITCSLLAFCLPSSIRKVVDIRTSFIYASKLKTTLFNKALKIETRFFKNISIVSAGVKAFLKLPLRTHVLPLGGPVFPFVRKNYDTLNFLYVGTFYDRNLAETIKAFGRFVASHQDKISLKYTIIGYGNDEDIASINAAISTLNLEAYVSYVGTVRYPALNQYFLNHNVGICYIPLTEYYDCQPPTKTYEYLLSGSVVLGTNTTENRKVVNASNGILVGETVDEFYKGMVSLYQRRQTYDTRQIQIDAAKYSWEAIVAENLIPYLKACK